jgi:hypothetical protein
MVKKTVLLLIIQMSARPQELIESLREALQRPIGCNGSCQSHRGTNPVYKINRKERIRREINTLIDSYYIRYTTYFKRNISSLFFFSLMGHTHFFPLGSKMRWMSSTQAYLMNFHSKRRSMENWTTDICKVDRELETLISIFFPRFSPSRDNMRMFCRWMEDVFPFVERCVLKKMLMTSMALSFLSKRLVGPITSLREFMFHSIFKTTLLRMKDSPTYSLSDPDLLNVIFPKRR